MQAVMNDYQKYIHLSRYSRFQDDLGRRENWEETVTRLTNYWANRFPKITRGSTTVPSILKQLYEAVLNLEVMPSMRTLMTAGEALDRDHAAGYNCSYLTIESPRDFDECLYILMCGTGVGFSVESRYTSKLPEVPDHLHPTDTTIVVGDSKIGWASSFRELLSLLWVGKLPKWDVSKVRPAGSRLKVFGGRASGPEPLVDLFNFTVRLFHKAAGRKLTSLECHDLVCKIADVVVVGGVRRSALISLSDLGDSEVRISKSGRWWDENGQRALANNSAVYESKPSMEVFLSEWKSLYESHSGERGIFSRVASRNQAARNGRREADWEFGSNPCSEIILRPRQFCNLSEVVVRSEDTLDQLKSKVRLATILGTLQSTLTDFRYLRKEWKRNTEEERLLGVSLTGINDHPILSGKMAYDGKQLDDWLHELKYEAIETNREWSELLGIQSSVAITCVKPSGTVSQLVDSASGIHPRFSPHYIRTIRADKKDPLAAFMIDQGFPYEVDKMKPDHQYVFSFPQKAPEGAVCTKEVGAMEQLELWMQYQEHWCEHKPSITVYYKPEEFLKVGGYVYENFDKISGVSFLPYTDHVYEQAPYQEITEEQYNEFMAKMPVGVDWSLASAYDMGEDRTEGVQQLACSSGICEI